MALYNDYNDPNNLALDAKAIDNAIKNILLTPIGTLPGKPLFGSRLYAIIFEHMDGITEELARRVINEALRMWEDRVYVTNVNIKPVYEYNRYLIEIFYRYKDDQLNYTSTISFDIGNGTF